MATDPPQQIAMEASIRNQEEGSEQRQQSQSTLNMAMQALEMPSSTTSQQAPSGTKPAYKKTPKPTKSTY
ncbi:hypothetical protein COLO4_36355 [Corchorus olitorius]|uniref:Uncharacterized protein n=1 Tax=Corchorus olitorius TaxID=93759 RepID=A0A1R3G9E9_9ROSI|nr:hypothetical protein COLO4_36355 [Corchorus olitorius]